MDGRCYVLLHQLQAHEVQLLSTLILPAVDATGIVVDRAPTRIGSVVRALVQVEVSHFLSANQTWSTLPVLEPFAASTTSQKVNLFDSAHMDLVLSSSRRQQLQAQLQSSEVQRCPDFAHHLALLTRHALISDRVERLKASLDESNLSQMADYQSKLEVLHRLDYVDVELTVQLKGRVACELNTCDALIGTELLFNNQLGDLTPEETVNSLTQHPLLHSTTTTHRPTRWQHSLVHRGCWDDTDTGSLVFLLVRLAFLCCMWACGGDSWLCCPAYCFGIVEEPLRPHPLCLVVWRCASSACSRCVIAWLPCPSRVAWSWKWRSSCGRMSTAA